MARAEVGVLGEQTHAARARHMARVGRVEARQHAQQRTFAASVFSNQGEAFARREVERHSFKNRLVAVSPGNLSGTQHVFSQQSQARCPQEAAGGINRQDWVRSARKEVL